MFGKIKKLTKYCKESRYLKERNKGARKNSRDLSRAKRDLEKPTLKIYFENRKSIREVVSQARDKLLGDAW